MIKIQRTSCPDCLDTTSNTLTPNDYKLTDVLNALLDMQHFKCCYCEKYLPVLGKTAKWVEHFIAKTDDSFKNANGITNWNRANAWSNLLYTCSTCNRSKGTQKSFAVSGKRNLIDPSYSRMDPERHIDFLIDDSLIVYRERAKSKLGKNTIENVKLKSRTDIYFLLRKQKLEIDSIFANIVNALIDGNTVMATSTINDLIATSSAHRPHASFNRKYIVQKVNKFNQIELAQINQYYNTKIAPLTVNIAKGSKILT